MLMMLCYFKPMNRNILNLIEIFNESTLLACFYLCLGFTGYEKDQNVKYLYGSVLIYIILANLVLNLAYVLYSMISQIKPALNYLKQKCKKAKSIESTVGIKPLANHSFSFEKTSYLEISTVFQLSICNQSAFESIEPTQINLD